MILFVFGLSKIFTIILFLIIICFLIAWHELGHLIAAKKCNVYCYEYSIGFGPLIYRNKKHETHFCIRAIPLGGFVKMAGEEGLEEGEKIQDNDGKEIPNDRILSNKSKGKRALVMAAGGLMNMILAIFCFYFFVSFNHPIQGDKFTTGFIQQIHSNEIFVGEDSLLSKAGMENNDKIIKIETRLTNEESYQEFKTNSFSKIQKALDKKAPQNVGDVQEIKITYQDANEDYAEKTITVTREKHLIKDENNKDVEEISKIGLSQAYKICEYNAITGIWGTFHFTGYYALEVCRAFGQLFTGDFSGLSGLVGIYQTVDDVATDSYGVGIGATMINMIYLIGAISFSLGFFNLIPFPALDGGRLFFVGIEAITKKKVNPKVEGMIHTVGLFILFALMIIINIRDIMNLFVLLI